MGAQCEKCFGKKDGSDPYGDHSRLVNTGVKEIKPRTESIISDKAKIADFNQSGDDVKKLTEK